MKPGDQVELSVIGKRGLLIEARTVDAMSLAGSLKSARSISLEDMEHAIAAGATGQ